MRRTLGEGDPELFDTLGGTYADGFDESARRAIYGGIFRRGKRILDEARASASALVGGAGGGRVPPGRPTTDPLK